MNLTRIVIPVDAFWFGGTIAAFLKELTGLGGGYTMWEGKGGWLNPASGTIQQEAVYVFEAAHSEPLTAVKVLIQLWGMRLNQKSIYYVHNGVPHIMEI